MDWQGWGCLCPSFLSFAVSLFIRGSCLDPWCFLSVQYSFSKHDLEPLSSQAHLSKAGVLALQLLTNLASSIPRRGLQSNAS
eukprot:scaffold44140_cov17-Tisochrysis_lutea.AAC.1